MANIVNPLEGVAQSVGTGLQIGARMREQELKKEMFAEQKKNFEMQRNTHKVNLLTKVTNDAKKLKLLSPAVAKASFKRIETNLLQAGIPLSEELKAMALDRDPEAMLNFSKGMQAIQDGIVTSEDGEAAQKVIDIFGTEKVVDLMMAAQQGRDKLDLFGAQMAIKFNDKQWARTFKEKQFTDKKSARADKFQLDLSNKFASISKEYKNQTGAAKAVLGAGNTSADHFNALKGFNQFFDTARVTTGEIEAIKSAQSLYDKVIAAKDNWIKGTLISPKLMNQMKTTTRRIKGILDGQMKSRAMPYYKQMRKQNFRSKDTMPTEIRSLFSKELGIGRTKTKSNRQQALAAIKRIEAKRKEKGKEKLTAGQKVKIINKFMAK